MLTCLPLLLSLLWCEGIVLNSACTLNSLLSSGCIFTWDLAWYELPYLRFVSLLISRKLWTWTRWTVKVAALASLCFVRNMTRHFYCKICFNNCGIPKGLFEKIAVCQKSYSLLLGYNFNFIFLSTVTKSIHNIISISIHHFIHAAIGELIDGRWRVAELQVGHRSSLSRNALVRWVVRQLLSSTFVVFCWLKLILIIKLAFVESHPSIDASSEQFDHSPYSQAFELDSNHS